MIFIFCVLGFFLGGGDFKLFTKFEILWQSSDGHSGSSVQGNEAQTDKLVFWMQEENEFGGHFKILNIFTRKFVLLSVLLKCTLDHLRPVKKQG